MVHRIFNFKWSWVCSPRKTKRVERRELWHIVTWKMLERHKLGKNINPETIKKLKKCILNKWSMDLEVYHGFSCFKRNHLEVYRHLKKNHHLRSSRSHVLAVWPPGWLWHVTHRKPSKTLLAWGVRLRCALARSWSWRGNWREIKRIQRFSLHLLLLMSNLNP